MMLKAKEFRKRFFLYAGLAFILYGILGYVLSHEIQMREYRRAASGDLKMQALCREAYSKIQQELDRIKESGETITQDMFDDILQNVLKDFSFNRVYEIDSCGENWERRNNPPFDHTVWL